jgi:NDP-sugar pyrophosphorylase family protein
MLNIVIPMAGAGSRFANAGFKDPKPLIQVNGVEMIRIVINNLRPKCMHKFIFICQEIHDAQYDLKSKLLDWAPGAEVIFLNGMTEGSVCSVLTAKDLINTDNPLMIANSDQYIDANINNYLKSMDELMLDGLIMTMKANNPKWSFVGLTESKLVSRVVEKEVISDEATVGIYNFRRGCDFVNAAEVMIEKNLRVNNEFYVAPTYNELINLGSKVGIYNIGREGAGMYGLGIPSDLDLFLSLPVAAQATQLTK